MAAFVEDCLTTADLVGAAARAKLSLLEVRRARGTDLAFDQAMVNVDQVLRLAVYDNLLARAAAGDHRATDMLAKGLGELLKAREAATSPEAHAGDGSEAPREPFWFRSESGFFEKPRCPHCNKIFDLWCIPERNLLMVKPQRDEWPGTFTRGDGVTYEVRPPEIPCDVNAVFSCCGHEHTQRNDGHGWRCPQCGRWHNEPVRTF